jgi:hypothetical protein
MPASDYKPLMPGQSQMQPSTTGGINPDPYTGPVNIDPTPGGKPAERSGDISMTAYID